MIPTHEELKECLDNMGTLAGMAIQIKRCFELSYDDRHSGSVDEILIFLHRTVAILKIGLTLHGTGIPPEGGGALLVAGLREDLTWEGWFRGTHWHILQRFIHGALFVNVTELKL